MKDRTIFKTGMIGMLIAAICCFMPALVLLLSAIGLSAWLAWLDYILLPGLVLFMAIAAYGFLCRRRKRRKLLQTHSTITCPHCGHAAEETMPTDACQFFYECRGCGALLKPHKGDCCVFCSYGTQPCPPIQEARKTGATEQSCCSYTGVHHGTQI